MSIFQVSQRFAHKVSGNTGTIVGVNLFEGTVNAVYDSDIYTSQRVQQLQEKDLRLAKFGEKRINGRTISDGAEHVNSIPGHLVRLHSTPPVSAPCDHSNQLINQLYHDRSRLEKSISRVIGLLDELGEAMGEDVAVSPDKDPAVADEVLTRISQWIVENE